MPTRPCEDCGKHISMQATTCPNCGAPALPWAPEHIAAFEQRRKQTQIRFWATCIVTAIAVVACVDYTSSRPKLDEAAMIAACRVGQANWLSKFAHLANTPSVRYDLAREPFTELERLTEVSRDRWRSKSASQYGAFCVWSEGSETATWAWNWPQ